MKPEKPTLMEPYTPVTNCPNCELIMYLTHQCPHCQYLLSHKQQAKQKVLWRYQNNRAHINGFIFFAFVLLFFYWVFSD